MNSTALGAEKAAKIVFISKAHEKFYYEKMKETRYQNVYHKALVYCLGISDDTRRNIYSIYDFKTGCVKTECLHECWQTSGSGKVVRMAYNLYCNNAPGVSGYDDVEELQKVDYWLDILCAADCRTYQRLKAYHENLPSDRYQWLLDVLGVLQEQGAFTATAREQEEITAQADFEIQRKPGGRRPGLARERSGLFREAVRIIKEMKGETDRKYPRFPIWENVSGALSSSRRRDFKAVLESFTETKIPMPCSGRWAYAGMVRSRETNLAWCVYDARLFGTDQRRRRVFPVASFGNPCAGLCLKNMSVCRDIRMDGRRLAGMGKLLVTQSGTRC